MFWLEQTIAEVPATDEWLAPVEQEKLRSFRIPKRASDWRLGRWTAKRTLAHSQQFPAGYAALAAIEIIPAESGVPRAFVQGKPSEWSISISHSNGRAACAAARGAIPLGCDVERIEARSDAFLADYFTSQEQETIQRSPAADRSLLHTLFWSAKESAMKALGEGLRLDTRSVSVTRIGCPSPWSHWTPLEVAVEDGAVMTGWWRADHDFVRTVVSSPGSVTPRVRS